MEKLENFFLNILDKIKLKKIADIYRDHREGMRYLIFGGLSTLVNIFVYIVCSHLIFINLNDDLKVNLSNSLAIIISILFAYITNKLWVFETKTENKKDLLREFTSFIGCRAITALIDLGLMQLTVNIFKWNDILMKILVNILVILLNFVFSKLIIFKKKEIKN